MKLRTLGAVSVIATLTAGCSAVRVIDYNGGQNYYDGAFEFATQSGKINTYIAGAPFSTVGGSYKFSITSMMYAATFGRKVNFVATKPNTEKYGFHIVVAFNVVNPLGVDDICQDATQIKSQPNLNTTSMLGVFCQGGYPLSYANGYVSGLTGSADPKFARLVREVALAMIPRYDDQNSSGGEAFR